MNPLAVSPVGAQGIAQFMPGTAAERGLTAPFDPHQALPKSAEFLAELRQRFGNLGLAAAAYNAGPQRVTGWLAGRRSLPLETRNYVMAITGYGADLWRGDAALQPRADIPTSESRPVQIRAKPSVWRVQLKGAPSESAVRHAYADLQRKFPSVLGGHSPMIVRTVVAGRLGWIRAQVGMDTREGAERLCSALKAAGGDCIVQRAV
jgi:hypothetical protein